MLFWGQILLSLVFSGMFLLYLDESDLFAMEGERLVDLSSLHGGHVVHLVLAQLVGHLNVLKCLRLCLSISSITFPFSVF